jgi:O-antigen/teichoic acid export membrane protein
MVEQYNMNWKINVGLSLKYAIIEAVLFSTTVYFYVRNATYQKTWLLFLGAVLFLIVTVFHTLKANHSRSLTDNTFTLVIKSYMITIAGIIFSCIFSFLIMAIMIHGYLGHGPAQKLLKGAPSNTISDKTNGLSIKVFLVAIVGNFIVGSIAGLIMPFYSDMKVKKDLSKKNRQ